MLKHGVVFLHFVIVSCNSVPDSNSYTHHEIVRDTLIIYDIEGISTEGGEAKVNYVNGRIFKSVTSIYGESGQATIIYEFETDKIKVIETKYSYNTTIDNVKSEEDMKLEYETSYFIDFYGNIIGKKIPNRIDIFREFKKFIPFELSKKKY
ncbi:MAG TPA: hypothetical protein VLZ75_04720 [Chitinophagales bacterium]|nr:hypothetical protein [Chitinophagales bacterium]